MSIFTPTQSTAAQQVANQLTTSAANNFKQLAGQLAMSQKALWSNPRATVDEIVTALGTNAADVFNAGVQLQTMLNTIVPGTNTFAAPRAFTINADGSVTLAAGS